MANNGKQLLSLALAGEALRGRVKPPSWKARKAEHVTILIVS
jgi:hypothetical protein